MRKGDMAFACTAFGLAAAALALIAAPGSTPAPDPVAYNLSLAEVMRVDEPGYPAFIARPGAKVCGPAQFLGPDDRVLLAILAGRCIPEKS